MLKNQAPLPVVTDSNSLQRYIERVTVPDQTGLTLYSSTDDQFFSLTTSSDTIEDIPFHSMFEVLTSACDIPEVRSSHLLLSVDDIILFLMVALSVCSPINSCF